MNSRSRLWKPSASSPKLQKAGIWKADGDTLTLTVDDDPLEVKYDKDTITFEIDDLNVVFEKFD